MSRFLRFHDEGLLELEDVAERLGHAFLTPTRDTLNQLCILPFAWPRWPGRDDVHRRVLKKWPYSIIYAVDAESVRRRGRA